MILITGAAGFIGSNLVHDLNAEGRTDLILCDWLGKGPKWHNIKNASFRDFVYPEDLEGKLDRLNIEAVLHMGANSSTAEVDGDDIMRRNILFSKMLIDWCTTRVVPIVYASSAATYGDGTRGFVDDLSTGALRLLRPLNLYGWSKHYIDLLVTERKEQSLALPPKCIGLKFFNVYGPNESHKGAMMSVVGKSFRAVAAGETISLFKSHHPDYADGGQLRDFVYVDDVSAITRWCLASGPARGIFNVGTGKATSFLDFVSALFDACGLGSKISFVPMPEELRPKYQYYTEASMSKLRTAGYTAPLLDVWAGVSRYVELLRSADPYR